MSVNNIHLPSNHYEKIHNFAEKQYLTGVKSTLQILKPLNIKQNTIDNIGVFTTVTMKLKLYGYRSRMWQSKLSDVRLKEHNISTSFNLSLDGPTKKDYSRIQVFTHKEGGLPFQRLSVICFVNSVVVLSPPISFVLIPVFTKSKIVDSSFFAISKHF